MAQALQEASEGAVPQQGAVPPVVQGAVVGHMPDAQVLSLDVEVARVFGKASNTEPDQSRRVH